MYMRSKMDAQSLLSVPTSTRIDLQHGIQLVLLTAKAIFLSSKIPLPFVNSFGTSAFISSSEKLLRHCKIHTKHPGPEQRYLHPQTGWSRLFLPVFVSSFSQPLPGHSRNPAGAEMASNSSISRFLPVVVKDTSSRPKYGPSSLSTGIWVIVAFLLF